MYATMKFHYENLAFTSIYRLSCCISHTRYAQITGDSNVFSDNTAYLAQRYGGVSSMPAAATVRPTSSQT